MWLQLNCRFSRLKGGLLLTVVVAISPTVSSQGQTRGGRLDRAPDDAVLCLSQGGQDQRRRAVGGADRLDPHARPLEGHGARRDDRGRTPFHWAAFQLFGDWK